MKTLRYLLLFGSLFLGFSSCSDDNDTDLSNDLDTIENQDTTDEGVNLEALILLEESYGEDSQQVFDIYLPEGRSTATTKIILLVHGGGWVGGDKEDMTNFISDIQQAHPDHAIVNMNYVLANLSTNTPAFPNQYLDIDLLINTLVAQSETLHIRPEIGIIGTSAGAHLGMIYDYVYDTTDRVKFVVDIVGPSNFSDPFYADDPNFNIALSLLTDETAFPEGIDLAMANSPSAQVNIKSSPTLLFYGNQDPLVPLTNGQSLDTALNQFEIPHSFTIYDGGHGDDWSDASILDLRNKINNFIDTHLGIN